MAQKLVYIVDGDYHSTNFYRLLMRSYEFSVEIFDRPNEAFERIKEKKPDLVLSELAFANPQEDTKIRSGIDLAKKTKELYKELPMIAVTASAMNYDRNNALDAGFNYYFSKPVGIENLIETMKSSLN